MRNWYQRLIRYYLSFFLLFTFLIAFSQVKKDSNKMEGNSYEEIECNRYVEQLEKRNLILKNEAKNIKFKKLDCLILEEIAKEKFSKDSVIVFIERYRKGYENLPCLLNHKLLYPNYSEYEFWTPKNISKLEKKTNKKINLKKIKSFNDLEKDVKNANFLCLEFINEINKIIVIKYIFEKYVFYKSYQYQNNKWVEIPTTDEYKF